MRHFGWGTVTGLGMAGLLAAALPALAQYGGSSSSPSSPQQPSESSSSTGQQQPSSTGTMGGTGSSAATTPGAPSAANELTGTVQKFDRDANQLTLANSDKKLRVSSDTQVMKDGQVGSLSDIREGDQVRASYSGTGDTVQVHRIEVMSAGSKSQTGSYGAPSTPSTPAPESGTGTAPGGGK
jgi:Cu/Ag efflux protein CusF